MLSFFSFSDFKKKYNESSLSWSDFKTETSIVRGIINDVRENGDEALFRYTLELDGVEIDKLQVTPEEFDEAADKVEQKLQDAIKKAGENIENFHRRQLPQSFWQENKEEGIILGQLYRPLDIVGAYIPGGTASYPSSVLMTVIPARIAGVAEICLFTPPDSDGSVNPVTLFAAKETGVKKVFKVGGAQAVAAMAYGTVSVPRVRKIVGPGNIYVTLAKKEVYGDVGIDMLAGPSEVMIVANSDARPDYIAADLLSQAEHGALSRSILVTDSQALAKTVNEELKKQLELLPRRDMAAESLINRGAVIIAGTYDEIWETVNMVAPEHLELIIPEPRNHLSCIKNAGSIFLGPYSPEPLGDYWAGPNHVLPTGAAAKYASPLGVNDFLKYSQVVSYSREALEKASEDIENIARVEGLDAHARSVSIRKGTR